MVAQKELRYRTVEEWRELVRQSPDHKYEYVDGQIYLMAGGTGAHNRICNNATHLLEDVLERTPCSVYSLDMATRVSISRYTYPDVVVTCDAGEAATTRLTEIQSPRVVFEVLSSTTEAYDRGVKFSYYRQCPTVQEYVLVATDRQAVEVYRRAADGWGTFQAYGPGDEIAITSLDVRFSLAALYRRTDIPESLSDDQPEGNTGA